MRRALVSSLLALVILALPLAGCRSHGSSDTAGPGGTSGPGAAGGAGGSAPAVEVSVRETRERTAPERARSLGNVEDTVVDGQTVPVGSGKVDVLICLPPAVSPESLAASVSSVPPAEVFASDSRTLAVSWPGVSLEGMPLPDPAELVANGQAPSGYALVMNLTIDPVKAPVFKDLAGSDGLWTLTIERHRPPDYAVTCPDNPLVRLPYPDPEDPVLHYLSRGEHRLTITFTKPMDRRSVEEVLTGSPTFEVTDLVWTDDQTLEVSVGPSPEAPWTTPRLDLSSAVDQDGLSVWFTDCLVFLWGHETKSLAKAPLGQPASEALLSFNAGLWPVAWSPGEAYLPAWERRSDLTLSAWQAMEDAGEFPLVYRSRVYRAATGDWWSPPPEVRLASEATWLDADRLFLTGPFTPGWQVLDLESGRVTTDVLFEEDPRRYLCAITPGPGRVAAYEPQGGRGQTDNWVPADLVVFDFGGKELRRWPAVTRVNWWEYGPSPQPLAWLPDAERLIIGQRAEDGTSRLAILRLSDGKTAPIPGSEEPLGGDLFTAPGGGVRYASVLGDYQDGPTTLAVAIFDLDAAGGKRLFSRRVHDTGLSYLDNCFPSPDGRHLALVQTDREPESPALTVVIDAATGETVPGYPIPGEAIGWTADGQNLYIVVAAD